MTPQGRGSIGWRDSVCPATWLMPNRWHGGWQPAAVPPVGHQPRRRTHAGAPPNRSSTLGRHRVPAADRPDAFEDRCSTGLAVAHLRNDDHPAQPHGIVTTLKRWACGWEPYRLVWFQTSALLRHVQTMFNEWTWLSQGWTRIAKKIKVKGRHEQSRRTVKK